LGCPPINECLSRVEKEDWKIIMTIGN
jgi:hypothetical protein